MKVEQCIIQRQPDGSHKITDRVWLACELVDAPDGPYYCVRLLEAGAGLQAGAELTVHASKVAVDS